MINQCLLMFSEGISIRFIGNRDMFLISTKYFHEKSCIPRFFIIKCPKIDSGSSSDKGITMTKRRRIQKLLVWLFIFILPLAWAKDSLFAPVFLKAIDKIHWISLNFEHGELHLTLHHEENGKLDAEGKYGHGYNLLSDAHPFNNTLHQHSLDHEFHISAGELRVTASRKNTENSKSFAPSAISWNMPLSWTLSSATFLSEPHTEINSTHLSIRTTVLLI